MMKKYETLYDFTGEGGGLSISLKVKDGEILLEVEDPVHDSSQFTLPPTPEGLGEAKKIIGVLSDWIRGAEKKGEEKGFHKCGKCPDGIIQHTSFPSPIDENKTIHVYGCNRCESGWNAEER